MGLQQVLERLAVTFYVITFMSGAHVNYQCACVVPALRGWWCC